RPWPGRGRLWPCSSPAPLLGKGAAASTILTTKVVSEVASRLVTGVRRQGILRVSGNFRQPEKQQDADDHHERSAPPFAARLPCSTGLRRARAVRRLDFARRGCLFGAHVRKKLNLLGPHRNKNVFPGAGCEGKKDDAEAPPGRTLDKNTPRRDLRAAGAQQPNSNRKRASATCKRLFLPLSYASNIQPRLKHALTWMKRLPRGMHQADSFKTRWNTEESTCTMPRTFSPSTSDTRSPKRASLRSRRSSWIASPASSSSTRSVIVARVRASSRAAGSAMRRRNCPAPCPRN